MSRKVRRDTVDVLAYLRDAAKMIAEAEATGVWIVWLLPDGDYDYAYIARDLLEITAAVNDSTLKERVTHARGVVRES